jgi:outer membrane cobalamin receptor
LTNIFDKDYEAREGFNEPGRGFKVGVRYSL